MTNAIKNEGTPPLPGNSVARRTLLKCAMGAALCGGPLGLIAATDDPAKLPPQPGDVLVYPSWEEEDRVLLTEDLTPGAEPVLVYPRDPGSGVIRERSRLNQLLALRLEPAAMDPDTREQATGSGVIVYSGICTHAACGITAWDAAQKYLICPCHSSTFDAGRRGARVTGPATRALPTLRIAESELGFVITGPFSAPVGASSL